MKRAVAGLLLLSVALAGCTQSGQTGSKVGDVAPGFTLTTIGNETLRLADLRGQVVVLDLMGVNCPPCRAQTREFKTFLDRYDTNGTRIVSVDLGARIGGLGAQDEQDIHDFVAEFNATWTFAPDTDQVGERYEIISLPTLYVVGPDGVIRERHGGVANAASLQEMVAEAR